MIGAPSPLRDELVILTKRSLVNRCLRLRPETDNLSMLNHDPERLLMAGVKTALRDLARRWKTLDEEIKTLNRQLDAMVWSAAPQLIELRGVGVNSLDNSWSPSGTTPTASPTKQPSPNSAVSHPSPPAAAAPPDDTGSAAADRAANSALYIITIVRLRHHQPTRDYVQRRTAEGLSKREIIRCLKRYIAREIYHNLPQPVAATPSLPGVPAAA